MIDYEEKLEREQTYLENPFQIGTLTNDNFVIIGNLDKLNKLNDSGRLILKYVVSNLNQHTGITILNIIEICQKEFSNYPKRNGEWFYDKVANTLESKIRRGVRDLLYNKVIAKTKVKNSYWVNKSIIWR